MQVEALALAVRNKLLTRQLPSTLSDFTRLLVGFNEDGSPFEFMEMDIAMRRLLLDFDVALDAWAADQIMKAKEPFGQNSPTDSRNQNHKSYVACTERVGGRGLGPPAPARPRQPPASVTGRRSLAAVSGRRLLAAVQRKRHGATVCSRALGLLPTKARRGLASMLVCVSRSLLCIGWLSSPLIIGNPGGSTSLTLFNAGKL